MFPEASFRPPPDLPPDLVYTRDQLRSVAAGEAWRYTAKQAEAVKQYGGNRAWRLNNLYFIVNKDGEKVPFKLNPQQWCFINNLHSRNLAVKARQLGLTTICLMLMIDRCQWVSTSSCGMQFHVKSSATAKVSKAARQILADMPENLKAANPIIADDKRLMISWQNGSSLTLGNVRADTMQILLISEFGLICAEYPDVADEIVSGSLRAVSRDNILIVESTAEGDNTYFRRWCETAYNRWKAGERLTSMDWQLFFFAWWLEAEYSMRDADDVVVPQWLEEYHTRMDNEYGVKTTHAQRAWHYKTSLDFNKTGEPGQGFIDFKHQYPGHVLECFEESSEGAVYHQQIEFLYGKGRITDAVAHKPALPVDTWWDYGMHDTMSIIFTQDVGREVHIIDYEAVKQQGWDYCAAMLARKATEHKYFFDAYSHHPSHDVAHVENYERGIKVTRWESARRAGVYFVEPNEIPTVGGSLEAEIDVVRDFLTICWIRKLKCRELVDAITAYHFATDIKKRQLSRHPVHDWSSHPCDALRNLAVNHRWRGSNMDHATADVVRQLANRGSSWGAFGGKG